MSCNMPHSYRYIPIRKGHNSINNLPISIGKRNISPNQGNIAYTQKHRSFSMDIPRAGNFRYRRSTRGMENSTPLHLLLNNPDFDPDCC